jgi:transcriptional regulator with XRE-family HTH domain
VFADFATAASQVMMAARQASRRAAVLSGTGLADEAMALAMIASISFWRRPVGLELYGATMAAAACSTCDDIGQLLWKTRALLDCDEHASKSGVAAVTAIGFEHGRTDPKVSTLYKWKRALEVAGVRFIDSDEQDGPGVRLRGAKGKR